MPDWRAAFFGLTTMACAARTPPDTSSVAPPDTTVTPPAKTEPTVEATYRDVWRGKPPLARYSFDVTLRNPSGEARWLILPSTFPYTGKDDPAPGGDESELTAYRLSSSPRVIIVDGVTANFQAVRLPGGGTVTLRQLGIESWWSERTAAVDLKVLVAREITIGGTPLAELLGEDLTCDTGADVDAAFSASHRGAFKSWHPPDPPKGEPVTFDVESRAQVSVSLER